MLKPFCWTWIARLLHKSRLLTFLGTLVTPFSGRAGRRLPGKTRIQIAIRGGSKHNHNKSEAALSQFDAVSFSSSLHARTAGQAETRREYACTFTNQTQLTNPSGRIRIGIQQRLSGVPPGADGTPYFFFSHV